MRHVMSDSGLVHCLGSPVCRFQGAAGSFQKHTDGFRMIGFAPVRDHCLHGQLQLVIGQPRFGGISRDDYGAVGGFVDGEQDGPLSIARGLICRQRAGVQQPESEEPKSVIRWELD